MKGRALGIYEPSQEPLSNAAEERRERLKPNETFGVRLLGRTVPAIRTPDGIRAMEKDFRPASAASVERYLASKFGDHQTGPTGQPFLNGCPGRPATFTR